MIRVAYRWTVESQAEAAFLDSWRGLTESIRNHHQRALGSTLLRSQEPPHSFVGLARWTSRHELEAFWEQADAAPLPGATLSRIDLFDEIADLTT